MKQIIDKLFKEIKEHPEVLNSSLSASAVWKRTQYITLSEIISSNLQKSEYMKGNKKK